MEKAIDAMHADSTDTRWVLTGDLPEARRAFCAGGALLDGRTGSAATSAQWRVRWRGAR